MTDVAKIKRNIGKMIDQGAEESEIDAYVASEGITVEALQGSTDESGASWADLPGNIPGSAYEAGKGFVEGITQMVAHPIDTLTAVDDLVQGAALRGNQALADRGLVFRRRDPETEERGTERLAAADAAGEALYNRYGTAENIKNTMVTDPVGSGLDLATVLSLGAGAIGKGPMVAGKVAGLPRATVAGEKLPRRVENILRRSLPDDMTAFNAMGDEAMLLDAGPSTVGLAQGAVTFPGPAKDTLAAALQAREGGRSARLLSDTERALGKARDPEALKAEVTQKTRAAASPFYEQYKANPPDLRGIGLEDILARQLTDPAKGLSTSARTQNLEWMNKVEDALKADTPEDVISRLHNLRQELDIVTEYNPMASSADKARRAVAQNVRNAVDDILKNRVPGFAEGDEIFARGAREKEAVDYGFESLDAGKSATFPETFVKEMARFSPGYVAEGQKSRLANAMGTQANDLAALKKMIGEGTDFNRKKLETSFGPQKISALAQSVDRENRFSQNFADVLRNSQTAPRLAGERAVTGLDAPRIEQGASLLGLGAKGLNKLIVKGMGLRSKKNAEALAKALGLRGLDARKLAADLAASKNPGDWKRKLARAVVAQQGVEGITSLGRE